MQRVNAEKISSKKCSDELMAFIHILQKKKALISESSKNLLPVELMGSVLKIEMHIPEWARQEAF